MNTNKYVIYVRKSSEEDDRQVLSIEAQLVELKEFAAKEKLEIVASFQEAKTAKEPGRTSFAEMVTPHTPHHPDQLIVDNSSRNIV